MPNGDLDPISGDWNTPANWTPVEVPNGPADTATFGVSHTTEVSISANTEVNAIRFTSAATNPYTITARPGLTLTISGVGIVNNSGITQNFVTAFDAFGNSGTIVFSNSATAGTNVAYWSSINFLNRSTAGSANISNIGVINFLNRSSAGSANIVVEDTAFLTFANTSTAGNASIFAVGTPGFQGEVGFGGSSTAGNATIRGFGAFYFSGSSRGGTAQIELLSLQNSGFLDISGHNAPSVTIGSITGDEDTFVYLRANNLTVGSNNLSTTFSGVIQDGGLIGGTGGSLTKIGTGTLDLTENNTYTGNTNVNRGVLQVDGSITRDTFVNHRGTLAGTGIINGNVTNNGRISPGSAGAPGMLTVVGNYTQAQYATLMIEIAGMNTGQFSVLDVMENATLNGFLDPVLLNGFVPSIGDSFVFLNYASFTGEFSRILHPVFNNGTEQWSVIYQNNNAILTVGPNTIPDVGSTFLLHVGLAGSGDVSATVAASTDLSVMRVITGKSSPIISAKPGWKLGLRLSLDCQRANDLDCSVSLCGRMKS